MVVLCLKLGTLTLKSLLLPVTCYYRVRTAVIPPLCLRYAFASGSLQSMEHQRTYNGLTTDLQPICIGRELKESSRKAQQAKISSLSYQSFTKRKARLREYIIWKTN